MVLTTGIDMIENNYIMLFESFLVFRQSPLNFFFINLHIVFKKLAIAFSDSVRENISGVNTTAQLY